ncbi:MAG: hypothetical protein RLZZ58_1108 [Pseudomonadota bacterium]
MTYDSKPIDLSTLIPTRVLMGLGVSTEQEAELRPLQVAPFRNRGGTRMGLNILAGLVSASALYRVVPPAILAAWFATLCLFSLWSFNSFKGFRVVETAFAAAAEYRSSHIHAVMTALVWSSAFMLQGLTPDLPATLTVWAVVLLLMVAMTMMFFTVPLACALFQIPVSIAGGGALSLAGQPVLGGVAFLVGPLLTLSSLRFGQSYIQFRRTEVSLQEKTETVSLLLREFEETSADWLWQTDSSRRLMHISPRLAYALGGTAETLEGLPFLQALSGDAWETGKFAPAMHDLAERMKRRESFSNLIVSVTIAGAPRWWELSASPRVDEQGKFLGFRGVGSDVTEQRTSAEKIAKMARYDNLTGLPNRLHLNETLDLALDQAIKAKSRCALLMIDLDRFKAVNDTLGHPVGDKLLAQVSARLKGLMGPNALCGRLGGDEFAVVMADIPSPAEAEALAERIITSISRPYPVDNHSLFVGASIGFAMGPSDGSTVETITRNADLALYKSKDQGGNMVFQYEASLHSQAEERRVMEHELRTALERGEFELHYQPVVEAADGTLDGFEALIRWKNAKLGNVSPAKFIPLAEDARLISPIGEWVLRTACHEAMRWPSNLKVAVNVSAEQLTDPGFAAVVVSALSQSGLPPRRLEIEVTESVFLRDGGGAVKVLDQLLGLGIRLSLDDFGTGYSSLGYLRKTQFSTIKVDRSFVQGAAKQSQESIAIIRAVVALADSLGMSTTAEGAETEHEVETIRALGCRKIQGYFYGRPMPAEDVQNLFGAHGVKSVEAPNLSNAA